jgi:hypothetical protein
VFGDEYEAWQRNKKGSDHEVRNPISYWVAKQDRYPRLSKMALDFLIIQPMSAKCEKVFSAAGKMVVSTRSRLDAGVIRICQILRPWYEADVLPDRDTELAPVNLDLNHVTSYMTGSNDDDDELEYKDQSAATSDRDSD